jgi:hypothetical protein
MAHCIQILSSEGFLFDNSKILYINRRLYELCYFFVFVDNNDHQQSNMRNKNTDDVETQTIQKLIEKIIKNRT